MHDEARSAPEEPPPVGGSWRRLYAAVLLNLLAILVVCWAFSRAFR
jgi:hypothetical protein